MNPKPRTLLAAGGSSADAYVGGHGDPRQLLLLSVGIPKTPTLHPKTQNGTKPFRVSSGLRGFSTLGEGLKGSGFQQDCGLGRGVAESKVHAGGFKITLNPKP